MLVVSALVALSGVPLETRAQTPAPGSRPGTTRSSNAQRGRVFILNVKDRDGGPVSSAIAFVGEVTTETSDTGGVIRIEQRPPVRLPMMIDVQAPGYRPRQILIDGFERGNIDVYLEKAENNTRGPRGERSVSVGELSQEKKDAAQKLEEAGIRALAAGENARAEGLLRAALEQSPSSSLVYTNLGIALVRQGRLEEAVVFLEKGFSLAPYSPITAGNLGLLRWVQGRREECYELLDRAIALGFTSALAHYNLGVLALGRGYYRQSAEELHSVDPKRFRYRDLYLSIALRGLRQPKPAAKAFQDFLQRNPVGMLQAVWTFATATGGE